MVATRRRGRWTAWTGSCASGAWTRYGRPPCWRFQGTESTCDYVSLVVYQDLKSLSLLVVRLYDTVKAVKVHKVNIQPSSMSPC